MAVAGWRMMLVGSHNKQRTDCPICTMTAVFPGKDNGLQLVKVKVSLAQLTAPVQYILPPKLNPECTTKVTAMPNRGSVPFLIHLIKAARVVTSLGERRVNLASQFVLSRLILGDESKGGKMLRTGLMQPRTNMAVVL
jgi:hypothetical protein